MSREAWSAPFTHARDLRVRVDLAAHRWRTGPRNPLVEAQRAPADPSTRPLPPGRGGGLALLGRESGDALTVQTVERIAVVALVVILLNGGTRHRLRTASGGAAGRRPSRDRSARHVRDSAGAAGRRRTRVVLGLLRGRSPGVLGAALAPTDPAVVFFGPRAPRGRRIPRRARCSRARPGSTTRPGSRCCSAWSSWPRTPAASLLVVLEEFALGDGTRAGRSASSAARGLIWRCLGRVRLGASENLRSGPHCSRWPRCSTRATARDRRLRVPRGLRRRPAARRRTACPAQGEISSRFTAGTRRTWRRSSVFLALGLTVDISAGSPAADWRDGAVRRSFWRSPSSSGRLSSSSRRRSRARR